MLYIVLNHLSCGEWQHMEKVFLTSALIRPIMAGDLEGLGEGTGGTRCPKSLTRETAHAYVPPIFGTRNTKFQYLWNTNFIFFILWSTILPPSSGSVTVYISGKVSYVRNNQMTGKGHQEFWVEKSKCLNYFLKESHSEIWLEKSQDVVAKWFLVHPNSRPSLRLFLSILRTQNEWRSIDKSGRKRSLMDMIITRHKNWIGHILRGNSL